VKEGVQVFLDGKLVVDNPQSDSSAPGGVTSRSGNTRRPQEPAFSVHFADTKSHSFRLEYTHSSKLFGAGITLEWQPPADVLRREALQAAEQSDVVVAFVGLSPNLEGEEMPVHVGGFSGGDRTEITLPKIQQDLLQALAATGKPLVVVLLNGSALAVNWAQSHAAAILEAWYPGEAGGTAIAQTLAGENNPAGRLPVTFYASLDQLPPFEDYSMRGRTYRYFTGKPLYPFGYGLSYARYDYAHIKLSSDPVRAGNSLTVQADVRNSSTIAGDEVAELYIDGPRSEGAPIRELKGFARIHLGAGETSQVSFTLDPRDLSVVTARGDRLEQPGAYHIFVGGSQPGDGARGVEATFSITGEQPLPR
jgi:beta-glucosidase